jgi:hypothetical protein
MKKFKLLESFAGKKKNEELSLVTTTGSKKLSISWQYKGAAVILTEDSELLQEVRQLSLRERVKTIEDVYKELNRQMPTLKNYEFLPIIKREEALNLQYQLGIVELFNEGWIADWTNTSQYKYYPWFRKGASGWFLDSVGGDGSTAILGSDFYYKDRETANHCVNLFIDIYKKTLK